MTLSKRIVIKNETAGLIHYTGIFIIALTTLLLEFTLTRILSVALWYHFAFMIISIALLGFGISGVTLAASSRISKIPSDKLLSWISLFFGASIVICYAVMNNIPFDPFSLLTESIQLLYLPVYYLLITIPFFFAGLIISIILTRFKSQIRKLYFFDLIGAGLACFVFVLLIPAAGGPGLILTASALAFLASIIFSYNYSKPVMYASLVCIGIVLSLFITKDSKLSVNSSPNKIYGNYIEQNPDLLVTTKWNTFSKIDVLKEEEKSADGYDPMLAIIDNGNATTNIPKVTSLPPTIKPADASNLAFAALDSIDKVFILGSAGGGEILTSLHHNAKSIVAVEINGLINDLIKNDLSYWTGPLLKNNKQVTLITDDARNVISSKRIAYDVIISAHTISASAVSSGAMSMVENYILTQEAVREYIEHLTQDGVIYISRPETQIPKLITTFKSARLETSKGVEKSKNHFIVFRRPPGILEQDKSFMAGIIYKKNGFSETDVIRIKNEAALLSLNIEYDPTSRQDGFYKQLIEADNIEQIISTSSTNISPATDDKPFFDNNLGFSRLTFAGMRETFAQDEKAMLALKDRPVAETTLLAILIQSVLAAALLILLPLKKAANNDEVKTPKYFLWYFALLGAGYIIIQISLIQKFTMFLGQPVYTLLTVVSTMLIASGLGSRFSLKFTDTAKKLFIVFMIISVLTALIGLLSPLMFNALNRLDLMWRIILTAVIIFPLGFFMGMPFPFGIETISDKAKKFTALAWGVNGFFSVIGSVLTIILAMILGFKIVFLIAAILYAAALLIISIRRKQLSA